MTDEDERDYWQEYKDDLAQGYIYEDGTPREPDPPEPDPQPLDLDAIDSAYEASLAEWQRGPNPVGPNTANVLWALLQLTTELRGYREAEEVWADLPTRTEWTMAPAKEQPGPASLWYATAEEAERAYGQRGQLWMRHLTIGAPIVISDQPPF